MSWLGSLAAKTETLLNKVDQAAGQALHVPEKLESSDHVSLAHESFLSKQLANESIQSSQNLVSDPFSMKKSNSPAKLSKLDSKKDPDSELFEFLNDTNVPVTSASQQPQNSSITQVTKETSEKDKKVQEKRKPDSSIKSPITATTISTTSAVMDVSESSLVKENQLLKDAVNSLNRELMSIASRGKSSQEEYNKAISKLEAERRLTMQRDATIRELQAQELDLNNALQAKEAQLGVLRVRLEEADMSVREKDKKIEAFHAEKDSILEDHSLSTGAQSQALDSLQNKLKEIEAELKSEQDKNQKLKTDMTGMMASMEHQKDHNASEIVALQKKVNNEKARASDLSSQLKLARSQADMNRQELNQYKEKATRILQSKEKLIGKLKDASGGVDGSGASEPVFQSTELESIRSERDMMREELSSLQLSLETAKAEFVDLEMQSEQEMEGMKEQLSMLEDAVASEKRKRQEVETEVAHKNHELKYLHEELSSQKSMLQGRVHEREAEIQKLRNQLTTRSLNASNNEELEGRLHSLTESLIQKQTHLEALSSEKHSLSLQLERVEKQFREAQSVAIRHTSSGISINTDDDDVRSRYNNLMHVSPFDGHVARNVKKAANSIDRFGMRLGLFMRRYPVVRVFIIVYMFILHLWVMVVLLTYQPEIHHPDYTFPHAP